MKVLHRKNKCVLRDANFNMDIPIHIYLSIYLQYGIAMKISINRKSKHMDYYCYGEPLSSYIFPLTSSPYFYPQPCIPYVNMRGYIVIEFTHELLDIMASKKINLHNNIIGTFIQTDNPTKEHTLLVTDYIGKKIQNKNIQQGIINSNFDRDQVIKCNNLISINGTNVNTLQDISNLYQENEISCQYVIELGLSSTKTSQIII